MIMNDNYFSDLHQMVSDIENKEHAVERSQNITVKMLRKLAAKEKMFANSNQDTETYLEFIALKKAVMDKLGQDVDGTKLGRLLKKNKHVNESVGSITDYDLQQFVIENFILLEDHSFRKSIPLTYLLRVLPTR